MLIRWSGLGRRRRDQFGGVLFGVVEVSAERDVQGHGVRVLVGRSGDWRTGRSPGML